MSKQKHKLIVSLNLTNEFVSNEEKVLKKLNTKRKNLMEDTYVKFIEFHKPLM